MHRRFALLCTLSAVVLAGAVVTVAQNPGPNAARPNPNDVKLTLHAFKTANLANTVHVARDGVEALEFIFGLDPESDLPRDLPKLILLDLKLPRVDGHEVLKRVKSDPRTASIPVVMLTSSSEERDVMRTYEVGANSYIIKPVDFEQFTESVRDIGKYWLVLNHATNS